MEQNSQVDANSSIFQQEKCANKDTHTGMLHKSDQLWQKKLDFKCWKSHIQLQTEENAVGIFKKIKTGMFFLLLICADNIEWVTESFQAFLVKLYSCNNKLSVRLLNRKKTRQCLQRRPVLNALLFIDTIQKF